MEEFAAAVAEEFVEADLEFEGGGAVVEVEGEVVVGCRRLPLPREGVSVDLKWGRQELVSL